MEVLSRPAWYIPFVVVVLHQVVQYGFGWHLPWLDAYLDPLLCLPVLLGLWLAERRWLWKTVRLRGLEVIIAGTALAVLCEEGFPRWQPAFVRDWWDYLAYAIGGLWFWLFINPNRPERTQPV